jgi:hypothetical protein
MTGKLRLLAALILVLGSCVNPLNDPPPGPELSVPPGNLGPPENLGQVLIRLTGQTGNGRRASAGQTGDGQAAGQTRRTLYPSGIFTKYTLNFIHEDGETAPELSLPAETAEPVSVYLKTGVWTIIAAGFMASDGGEPAEAVRGSAQVTVSAGKPAEAEILLDKIAPENGEPGIFSYDIEFPQDRISSAALTLSAMGKNGRFVPYKTIDLRETGNNAGRITLPPGYYRMDLRLAVIYPFVGKTEIVHIYPQAETAAPPSRFTEHDFPPVREAAGIEALEACLAELPENTEKNPYPIRLGGVDLSSKENTGNTLRRLCTVLNRFVALDLRDCGGTSIPSIPINQAPNKGKIVALILPDTVTSLESSAFSGYSALASAEMPKVTFIGRGAFKQCGNLESVFLPELEVFEDGSGADNGVFRDCIALNEVFLPKAESIGDYTFYNCSSLTFLSLPAVRFIGKSSFRGGADLSVVYLPRAESIGNTAFSGCAGILSLTLGDIPPVLGGSSIFAKDNPEVIYVPAAAVDAYMNTVQDYWSSALKGRIRALPD